MRTLRWLLLALVLQAGIWLALWMHVQAWDVRFREWWMTEDRTALYRRSFVVLVSTRLQSISAL